MGICFGYKKIEFPTREEGATWSYTLFHDFRERLAREIDVDLDQMDGFTESGEANVLWGSVDDLIVPFLRHSDCDGELSPDQCNDIYLRLLELVQYWPDDDYDKIHALRLAAMMEECAKNDWTLAFR